MKQYLTSIAIAGCLAGVIPAGSMAEEAKGACAVSEFTMGLRFQQQSAEVRALQLQA